MNALMLAGAGLALVGLLVALAGFARAVNRLKRLLRSRRAAREMTASTSVWAGAVDAREAYVPGALLRQLTLSVGGLLLIAAGLVFAIGGGALERELVAVDEARIIGQLEVRPAGPGKLRIRYHDHTGGWESDPMPGELVVAFADYLVFHPTLARVRLGSYARVTSFKTYASSADVLSNRALAMFEPREATAAQRWLRGRELAVVSLKQRFSNGGRAGAAELEAGPDGLSLRARGR